MSAGDSQSAITARKDDGFAMGESLGQIVLTGKPALREAKRSCDIPGPLVNAPAMAKGGGASAYKEEFASRVRWARIGRSYSQAQMADLLGVPQDKYKHYETRSFMPHELVQRFCLICAIDERWLFTGKGKAPAIAEPERIVTKRRSARRKVCAA